MVYKTIVRTNLHIVSPRCPCNHPGEAPRLRSWTCAAPARRADRPSGGERLHAGSPVSRRTGAQTWGRTYGVEMRKQQCQ